ncbi:MAG: substrate-binding domain-containing protein [Desulfobacterales bacterium]|nr:substrate-binding domain-containing protein [Desulfobacterales bacterium]
MLKTHFAGKKFLIVLSFVLSIQFLISFQIANAGNEKKIALVMKALSNPFFSKMEEGAKLYAKQNNIPLEVFGVERETDVERQIGIVENLISRNYGAIVIAPTDSKKLVPICKKALEKNIVVVNIDNPFHKETMDQLNVSIPFVGPDNKASAFLVGEYIKKKLAGKGNVIIIEGIRGVENGELRKQGFIEGVTQNSDVKIIASESANWHTDEALSLTVKLLKDNDSVDAIFCANDSMAIGALQAVEMGDKIGKILIAGYDNIDAVRYEMQSNRIQTTIEQHPELMGQYGVELAKNALKGKKMPDYVPVPVDLITYETFNKTIAISISDMQNPFFDSLYQGALKSAKLFGMKLLLFDAKNMDSQQVTDILNALKQNISAIIINPANSETIFPAIELANTKNIPVITVDRKSTEGNILCHIASDNIEGGRMAAKAIASYLKEQGNIIELEGIPGTSAAHERGMGFNEVIKTYSKIKIVAREVANFDRNEAKTIIMRLIKKGIKFDGVFAHNDNMILGAMEAIKASSLNDNLILIGFDAIEPALEALNKGEITATIAQKPELMGMIAVQNAAKYLRGEKIPLNIPVGLALIEK